jgi:hypothetical protein
VWWWWKVFIDDFVFDQVLLGGGEVVLRVEVLSLSLPEVTAIRSIAGATERKKRGGAHVSVPRFVKKLQR